MSRSLKLSVLDGEFVVARLPANAEVPDWALAQPVFSVTRTADELSILCPQNQCPDNIRAQTGFRAIRAEGPFDFSQVGVLASIVQPLANASISIFSVSTYDTDYIFVDADNLAQAVEVLQGHGHHFIA